MPGIVEDIGTASTWIATALESSGYATDFSPRSLWEIDRFFDEHAPGGTPTKRGLLSEDVGSRLFSIGSDIGEVARRELGGEWLGDDEDPLAEVNVELRLADGTTVWPVQRAMKRFTQGSEEGIAAYGAALGLDLGPRPEPPSTQRRRLFRR